MMNHLTILRLLPDYVKTQNPGYLQYPSGYTSDTFNGGFAR